MILRGPVDLVRCSHPGPVAAVTVIASGLALACGRGAGGAALVAAAVLAGQLAVGWNNDLLDREADRARAKPGKPLAAGALRPAAVTAAMVVAMVACVGLSLANGLLASAVHLAAVAAAFAYNAGLKRTPLSPLPYALAFGSLPLFVTLGGPASHPAPAWAVGAAALAGTGAHFAQVLDDVEQERALGIRGLPQLAGSRLSTVVAAALLLAAMVAVAAGAWTGSALRPVLGTGLLLTLGTVAAVAITAWRGRPKAAFRLTMAAAVLVVAALVAGGGRI